MFKTFKNKAIFFSNNCYFFQNPYNIELINILKINGYKIVFCLEKQIFPPSKEYLESQFINSPTDLTHRVILYKNFHLSLSNYLKSFSFTKIKSNYYHLKHFLNFSLETLSKCIKSFSISIKIGAYSLINKKLLLIGLDENGYLKLKEHSIFTGNSRKFFVSHELYFDDEIDANIKVIKNAAHEAVTHADLILSTDKERLEQLISGSKYEKQFRSIDSICIPVGYYSFKLPPILAKSRLNKILYTGTVSSTCSVDQLVKLFESNNKLKKYHLHFHSYHLYQKYNSISLQKVSFNCEPIPEPKNYIEFVNNFSIGLVLYFPDPQVGPHFGKNIRYIGYSSGKFSLLSMLGIPIICSSNRSFKELRNNFNFGYIIDDINEIPSAIENLTSNYQMHATESKRMYQQVLSPGSKFEELIKLC